MSPSPLPAGVSGSALSGIRIQNIVVMNSWLAFGLFAAAAAASPVEGVSTPRASLSNSLHMTDTSEPTLSIGKKAAATSAYLPLYDILNLSYPKSWSN